MNFQKAEQISTLFDDASIGIGLITLEGKILAANTSLSRLTGYSEQELLQHNVFDFYTNLEARNEILEQLVTSNEVKNFGVELKRKDGNSFFANIKMSKIILDGQEILLALIEDVTGHLPLTTLFQEETAVRKQFKQELKDQIRLVDSLLNVALETIEIVDANTFEYIKWNKTFSQLTGYADNEIVLLNPVTDFSMKQMWPSSKPPSKRY